MNAVMPAVCAVHTFISLTLSETAQELIEDPAGFIEK